MHTVARSDNAFVLTVLAQSADALPVCFPRPPPCRSIVKGLEFFSPVRRFCSHLPITKKTAESTVFSELHFTLERSLHEIVLVILSFVPAYCIAWNLLPCRRTFIFAHVFKQVIDLEVFASVRVCQHDRLCCVPVLRMVTAWMKLDRADWIPILTMQTNSSHQ